MKLLIITSIKEDIGHVSSIMEKARVSVFSVSEIVGHKTEHHDYLPDNWFGKNGEGTDSLLVFSFTENEKANDVLNLIRMHNLANNSSFPVRGFVCPVEDSSF